VLALKHAVQGIVLSLRWVLCPISLVFPAVQRYKKTWTEYQALWPRSRDSAWGQRGATGLVQALVGALGGATAKREVHPCSVFDDFMAAIAGHYICECMPNNEYRAQCSMNHNKAVLRYLCYCYYCHWFFENKHNNANNRQQETVKSYLKNYEINKASQKKSNKRCKQI
jgi:hypothetical protein